MYGIAIYSLQSSMEGKLRRSSKKALMAWEDEDMIVGISKLWKVCEGKMKKQKEMIYKDIVAEFTCEYVKASEVHSHPI